MNAITFEDFACQSKALEIRIDKAPKKSLFMRIVAFISLADESIELCHEMRRDLVNCPAPLDNNGCMGRLLAASKRISAGLNVISSTHLPLFFQRKKLRRAAEAWAFLYEDLEFVASAKKREAVSDLCNAVEKVAHSLPSWRETDLFQ